jgi:hypothetical protein
MSEENKSRYQLKPKSEWKDMTTQQLYELKTQMTNLYYDMRYSSATFSNQYLGYVNDIDKLIAFKEAEQSEQK